MKFDKVNVTFSSQWKINRPIKDIQPVDLFLHFSSIIIYSMEKILITSALPYANGPLHIGHIAGAYLPADIYTRYQKLMRRKAIHICGTDEHGVAITIRADKEGKTPKEIVDYYYQRIKEDFSLMRIEFDNFSRTSLPIHYETAQEFFLKLYERGYIEKKEVEQYYCPKCNRFLPDRYVEGVCPHCGYERARGDQCDNCGRWLDPKELLKPRCAICGTEPVFRRSSHYYLALSKLSPQLKKWLDSKKDLWKSEVIGLALSWVREGLKDRAITRDLEWGVPVPLKEAEGKVLYVWFDAPIGYISSTKEWAIKEGKPDLWKEWWLDKENTKLVHFIGKDNIIFHAIVWPAMLMGHGEYVLPDNVPANYYLNLEGAKISTSRNWAIWIKDLVSFYPSDYIRFGLVYFMPETKDSDFTFSDFKERVNNELVNNFGNFVNRTLSFINKYLGGRVGPLTEKGSEKDAELLSMIEEAPSVAGRFIENYNFRKGLIYLMNLSAQGNRYFDLMAPWQTRKKDKERTKRTLSICYALIRSLSVLIEPYLPDSALKIKKMINTNTRDWKDAADWRVLEEIELSKPEILYKKIEEEKIEIGKSKKEEKEKSEKDNKGKNMEYIEFNEFSKLIIKIGKITGAEKVKGADKLLKLTVDIGEEKITLVAGIAQFYSPEEVIGKEVPILVNLKPRKIRGVLSQGMMLAADEDGRPVFLRPEKEVKPGSIVR